MGALLLAACEEPPKFAATRTLWRGVTITNIDERPFLVKRVVANESPENSNCNNYPSTSIAPGESHTMVFLLCGNVGTVQVQTDLGSTTLTFTGE